MSACVRTAMGAPDMVVGLAWEQVPRTARKVRAESNQRKARVQPVPTVSVQ